METGIEALFFGRRRTMKRVEIVSFICVFALIVGGTFLAADKSPVSQEHVRAAMAQSAVATVPAGVAVMTSGGAVATAGVLSINDCTVAAVTSKETYLSGEEVALTIGARNTSGEARKIEVLIAVQTYRYYDGGRMPEPRQSLETIHNEWVSLELQPGEEKMTTIVLKGLTAEPGSDDTYMVYAVDKDKAIAYMQSIRAQLKQLQNNMKPQIQQEQKAAVEVSAAPAAQPDLTPEQEKQLVLQAVRYMARDNGADAMKYLCGFKMVEPPKNEKVDAYTLSDNKRDETR
jgi:uncharacterized protein YeaC (DUF1315 family)